MRGRKNANYKGEQHAPMHPEGQGSYANMPEHPIMKPFNKGASYRDGIMNNPAYGIDMDSEVDENGCR